MNRQDPASSLAQPVAQFDPKYRRNREGLVFVISGPSGAGKNTLINRLKVHDLGLHYIPSFTTREMRAGERQGDPYYFVSREAFFQMAERDEFLEYEQIHGNYYATHAKTYEYAIENGYDAIKDIDVNGAMNFKRRFAGHIVLVYVRPTVLDVLTDRLSERGDSEEQIRIRMDRIAHEESKCCEFDYLVYNDVVDTAVEVLLGIIQSKT